MNYQKSDCFGPAAPTVLEILVMALVLAAFVVRIRHQGFVVHAGYWLMAWVQQSDRVFENVLLAGLIHVAAISACFAYVRVARRFRASAGRTLSVGTAQIAERANPPFALFSA